jgi:hypothetical protein
LYGLVDDKWFDLVCRPFHANGRHARRRPLGQLAGIDDAQRAPTNEPQLSVARPARAQIEDRRAGQTIGRIEQVVMELIRAAFTDAALEVVRTEPNDAQIHVRPDVRRVVVHEAPDARARERSRHGAACRPGSDAENAGARRRPHDVTARVLHQ